MNLEALSRSLAGKITLDEIRAQEPNAFKEMFELNVLDVAHDDINGKNVIDVGAYKGFFSLLSAGLGAKTILAVEPNPENFMSLKANASKFDNILPVHCAVFDGFFRSVRLVEHAGECKTIPHGKVEARALSELMSMFPDDNDLVVKMDIEGAEYDALLACSARDLRRISTLFLETHKTTWLQKSPARKASFLKDYLGLMGFKMVSHKQIFCWDHDQAGNLTKYEAVEDQESMKMVREKGFESSMDSR